MGASVGVYVYGRLCAYGHVASMLAKQPPTSMRGVHVYVGLAHSPCVPFVGSDVSGMIGGVS